MSPYLPPTPPQSSYRTDPTSNTTYHPINHRPGYFDAFPSTSTTIPTIKAKHKQREQHRRRRKSLASGPSSPQQHVSHAMLHTAVRDSRVHDVGKSPHSPQYDCTMTARGATAKARAGTGLHTPPTTPEKESEEPAKNDKRYERARLFSCFSDDSSCEAGSDCSDEDDEDDDELEKQYEGDTHADGDLVDDFDSRFQMAFDFYEARKAEKRNPRKMNCASADDDAAAEDDDDDAFPADRYGLHHCTSASSCGAVHGSVDGDDDDEVTAAEKPVQVCQQRVSPLQEEQDQDQEQEGDRKERDQDGEDDEMVEKGIARSLSMRSLQAPPPVRVSLSSPTSAPASASSSLSKMAKSAKSTKSSRPPPTSILIKPPTAGISTGSGFERSTNPNTSAKSTCVRFCETHRFEEGVGLFRAGEKSKKKKKSVASSFSDDGDGDGNTTCSDSEIDASCDDDEGYEDTSGPAHGKIRASPARGDNTPWNASRSTSVYAPTISTSPTSPLSSSPSSSSAAGFSSSSSSSTAFETTPSTPLSTISFASNTTSITDSSTSSPRTPLDTSYSPTTSTKAKFSTSPFRGPPYFFPTDIHAEEEDSSALLNSAWTALTADNESDDEDEKKRKKREGIVLDDRVAYGLGVGLGIISPDDPAGLRQPSHQDADNKEEEEKESFLSPRTLPKLATGIARTMPLPPPSTPAIEIPTSTSHPNPLGQSTAIRSGATTNGSSQQRTREAVAAAAAVDEHGRRGKKSVVPGELDAAFFSGAA